MNYSKKNALFILFLILTTTMQAQKDSIDLSLLNTNWNPHCQHPIEDTTYIECFIDLETITFSFNEEKTEGRYISDLLLDAIKFQVTKEKNTFSFTSEHPMLNGTILSLSADKFVLQDVEAGMNYIYERQE